MLRNRWWGWLALALAVAVWPAAVWADEVRYLEKDGVTWEETVRTVRKPVTESSVEEREVTVYRPQCRTEIEERTCTTLVPVTEYRWEAYWEGRWNPFRQPYLAQRLVPRTRWEPRTEVVRVPVVRRELVAEPRTQKVVKLQRGFVNEPVVTRRVAVQSPKRSSDPFADDASALARGRRIGGVKKMESDPPRQGVETAWRPARVSRRK